MLPELLMGFDIRVSPSTFDPESKFSRCWPGMVGKVDSPLTVDREVWKSLVDVTHMRQLSDSFMKMYSDSTTPNGYWSDMTVMNQYFAEQNSKVTCWTIAITVVQTFTYQYHNVPGSMAVPPVLDKTPDSEWQLLGYDVEDGLSFYGGILDQWPEPLQTNREKLWGGQLNQYHLFPSNPLPMDMLNTTIQIIRASVRSWFMACTSLNLVKVIIRALGELM
jgi:hypothetical protein